MFDTNPANAELVLLMQRFLKAGEGSPAQRLAHEGFYQRLRQPVEHEALRATGMNRDIAASVMQEAWHKIFRSAHTYDASKSMVTTWARMITRKCATDEFRNYYKHHPSGSGDAGADDPAIHEAELDENHFQSRAGPLPAGDEALYAKQVVQATAACLGKLQADRWPNIRMAFMLYLDSDLTYEDVLEQLRAVAPPTARFNSENVRSWVRLGRDQMRACLRRKLDLAGGVYD